MKLKLKLLIPGVMAAAAIMLAGCSLGNLPLPWVQDETSETEIYTTETSTPDEEQAFGTVETVEPAPEAPEAPAVPEVVEEPASAEEEASVLEDSALEEGLLDEDAEAGDEEVLDEEAAEEEEPDPRIDEILEDMTLEEKVAQMFIVTPEALTNVEAATTSGDLTKSSYEEYPVGGFIYASKNLENEEQVTKMLEGIQEISDERIGLPVFTAITEEGGSASVISGNENFDVPNVGDMSVIGSSGDASAAYAVGLSIGSYLSKLGFNVNLAPNADVLGNPANAAEKYRSFGTDAEVVSDLALATADGLTKSNVIPVAKYFPGEGAARKDDKGNLTSDKTMDELEEGALIPFKAWADAKAGMIMVGHITLTKAVDDEVPASMSSELITDLLRDEMGFDGLVITDSLKDEAITEDYSAAKAAVTAIEAGADLLLMPESFHDAYKGVLDAIDDDKITEERIDESVRRIIAAKLALKGEDEDAEEAEDEDEDEEDAEEADDDKKNDDKEAAEDTETEADAEDEETTEEADDEEDNDKTDKTDKDKTDKDKGTSKKGE